MGTDRSPLFVRLSAPLLTQLDARIAADGRTKQAVVEDLIASQLRIAPPTDHDIVDLAGAAELLRVSEEAILERIRRDDFPARRFGEDWRISRAAVTAWMHGTDSTTDRSTGFAAG
ncbi:MAG: helix-turn-helix domain-containing protein [Ilumatobacteraceae bacterium]